MAAKTDSTWDNEAPKKKKKKIRTEQPLVSRAVLKHELIELGCNYRCSLKSTIVTGSFCAELLLLRGDGRRSPAAQRLARATLMSNTCFPPQPNRNRQGYFRGWFARRFQGLMFAIWEPQRVFTWSVIQKVVSQRIHLVPLCLPVAMHLC